MRNCMELSGILFFISGVSYELMRLKSKVLQECFCLYFPNRLTTFHPALTKYNTVLNVFLSYF